jgi:hypothetical protein
VTVDVVKFVAFGAVALVMARRLGLTADNQKSLV